MFGSELCSFPRSARASPPLLPGRHAVPARMPFPKLFVSSIYASPSPVMLHHRARVDVIARSSASVTEWQNPQQATSSAHGVWVCAVRPSGTFAHTHIHASKPTLVITPTHLLLTTTLSHSMSPSTHPRSIRTCFSNPRCLSCTASLAVSFAAEVTNRC